MTELGLPTFDADAESQEDCRLSAGRFLLAAAVAEQLWPPQRSETRPTVATPQFECCVIVFQ